MRVPWFRAEQSVSRTPSFIDRVLGPRVRGYLEDDLRRARLIAGANLLMAVASFCFVALLAFFRWEDLFIPGTLGAGLLFLTNVWLLRLTGRLALAGFMTCLIVLSAVIAFSWLQSGLLNWVFIWALVICVFAPLLMGPRLALLCVGLTVAHLLALLVAETAGHSFPPLVPFASGTFFNQLLALLAVAAFSGMSERSRREALSARDAARASLAESAEARIALSENLKAVVLSVDPALRFVTGNSWFATLSQAQGRAPLSPGQPVLDGLDGLDPSQRADLEALFERALGGQHVEVERSLQLGSETVDCEILLNPIRRASGEVRGVTVFGRDIGARKRAQAELERLNRELANASHLAGKAEVATDVLHNVGNVLTAICASADLILERLHESKASFVGKTIALLPTQPEDLARFLTADEKGQKVRAYLGMLGESLEQDRAELIDELQTLNQRLDHVKSVVARQQSFARTSRVVELVEPAELIEEALKLEAESFSRHGIAVKRELAGRLPGIALDRHQVLQILSNFLLNSRQSLAVSTAADKRVAVCAFRNERGNLQIDVVDNGIGIALEQQGRLFAYGYTTKQGGHGFGLASSLLSARSMGGTVRAHSDGIGKGATFTIEIPYRSATDPSEEQAV